MVFLYRMCLLQSLMNVFHLQEYVKSKGVEVRFNGRGKNEASHYCGQCEVSLMLSLHAVYTIKYNYSQYYLG